MITASLRAVADIADTFPYLCDILAKKLDNAVSFKLPMALAALRNAILSRLLPFSILLLNTLPPLVSPLKSSQGLSVEAGSPFTFQPGLHSCYYATILTIGLS